MFVCIALELIEILLEYLINHRRLKCRQHDNKKQETNNYYFENVFYADSELTSVDDSFRFCAFHLQASHFWSQVASCSCPT